MPLMPSCSNASCFSTGWIALPAARPAQPQHPPARCRSPQHRLSPPAPLFVPPSSPSLAAAAAMVAVLLAAGAAAGCTSALPALSASEALLSPEPFAAPLPAWPAAPPLRLLLLLLQPAAINSSSSSSQPSRRHSSRTPASQSPPTHTSLQPWVPLKLNPRAAVLCTGGWWGS